MNSPLLRGGARMAFALLLSCAAVTAAGCRATDTSALEAENRMLEDQLYELQDHCQQLHDELASTRRASATERRDSSTSAEDVPSQLSPPSVEGMPELPSGPTGDEPYLRTPAEESEAPPYQMPSAPPSSDAVPGELPPFEATPGEAAPRQASYDDPQDELDASDPDAVVSITLNRRLTGGHGRAPHGGHRGILVVVEPRTRDGRIVPVEGDVSVGVLDPDQPAGGGRLARWDFSRDESVKFYRRTPMGDGLHFDLPWPADPPPTETVKLWVRLTTPEGRKLLAQRTVRVDPGIPPDATEHQPAEVATPSPETPSPMAGGAKPEWSPLRPR